MTERKDEENGAEKGGERPDREMQREKRRSGNWKKKNIKVR